MSVSVVINTFNRRAGLADTLDGLRRQTFTDFEVVVVNGPSTDGTSELLAELRDAVRVVEYRERHLSRSRNLGIEAAAGDIVAFIDDDAVPTPRWLDDLVAAYDDDRVGGAGGLVLDSTGVRVQYRYSLCYRTGELDFDREPPFDGCVRPGADPFLYLQGTNCSFRRAALVEVGGFDEEIEYNYDEAELCLQLIDAGWRLRALPDAVVHHRFLPSERRTARAFTDPFLEVKNRVYFGLRHGRRGARTAEALAAANRHLAALRAAARAAHRRGDLSDAELARYLGRSDAGFHAGLRRGLDTDERARRPLTQPGRASLRHYPVFDTPQRRRVALVGHPPGLARQMAAAGHEVHRLVPGVPQAAYRIDFEQGVWVHTVPVQRRWLPELEGSPVRRTLEQAAALRAALDVVRGREPVDVQAQLEPLIQEFLQADKAGVEGLLRRAARLDRSLAARAAHRLLESDRFPIDYEALVRPCLAIRDDSRCVECLYAALLGRAPEPFGRLTSVRDLRAGGERLRLVERIVGSVEARGRGVDPAFLRRLPVVSLAQAEADLRAAWPLDEDGFAHAVHRTLVGHNAGAAATAERLRHGLARRALVKELAAHPEVVERVAGAERLPPPAYRWDLARGVLSAAARRLMALRRAR